MKWSKEKNIKNITFNIEFYDFSFVLSSGHQVKILNALWQYQTITLFS